MYPGNKRNTPTYKVIPNIKVEHLKNDCDSSFSKEITLCNNIDLNETYSYYKYMNDDLSNTPNENDNQNTNTYKYNAIEGLDININNAINYHTVFVCAYKVVDDGLHPFLQYLLYKEKNTDVLEFPNFNYVSPEHSVNYSTILLNKFLFKYNSESNNYFSNCIYNGSKEYLNNLYLFFDITKCKVNIYDVYSDNKIWFAIMDEIINHKKLCNFQIDENICDFFINNDSFIFIQNEKSQNYELPVVAYINSKKEKVIFTYTFGVIKTKTTLGDNYIFTNYANSIQNNGVDAHNLIVEQNKSEVTFGIIRFALFLKVSYTALNNTISGFNNWENQYDSISISNIKVADRTFSDVTIIKDYEQQHPLSYHYCKYNETNNSIL
jgi:hypothetical protein